MKPDPILEELWRVKDNLAREAGYDIDRIFAELRAAELQQTGRLIHTAEQLRHYAGEQESRRDAASALQLREEPTPAAPPNRHE